MNVAKNQSINQSIFTYGVQLLKRNKNEDILATV